MSVKQCREIILRARSLFLRNDFERGLDTTIAALQKLGSENPNTELRSQIREMISYVLMDPKLKEPAAPKLSYTPEQEKALLEQLTQVRTYLFQAAEEDFDTALQRKIKIDQAINEGNRWLAAGDVAAADKAFYEATASYRDEVRLFLVIGQAFMDAREYTRALPYLKRGAEEAPDDPSMQRIFRKCLSLKEEQKK